MYIVSATTTVSIPTMTNGVMPTPAVMQGADMLMNSFVCNDEL